VRRFKEGSIGEQDLETVLRAGMAAPTAKDCRPWHFIVIREREILDALARELPYAKMAFKAQAGIIVVGDPALQAAGIDFDYWVMDGSAATQNILLAIESLGLGAVWTAVYPRPERIAPVRRILGIPDSVIPLNLIPVGIPMGVEEPRDKYDPERVHVNGW